MTKNDFRIRCVCGKVFKTVTSYDKHRHETGHKGGHTYHENDKSLKIDGANF